MGKITILVCDDEPALRTVISAMIRNLLPSAEVTKATDGQIGIDLIEAALFNLIITDFQMPKADGIAVVKAARNRSRDTVIILASGAINDDPRNQILRDAMEAGANFALRKPFTVQVLKDCLKEEGLL